MAAIGTRIRLVEELDPGDWVREVEKGCGHATLIRPIFHKVVEVRATEVLFEHADGVVEPQSRAMLQGWLAQECCYMTVCEAADVRPFQPPIFLPERPAPLTWWRKLLPRRGGSR